MCAEYEMSKENLPFKQDAFLQLYNVATLRIMVRNQVMRKRTWDIREKTT